MITPDKSLNSLMPKAIKRRVKERDNPLQRKNPMLVLVDYNKAVHTLKSNYNLQDASFSVLCVIGFNWLLKDKGITVWSIVSSEARKGNVFASTKNIVDRLVKKGLIEVIGTGKQGAYLYILTKQGEDEFGLLVKSMYV